jgi:hypothetical protein
MTVKMLRTVYTPNSNYINVSIPDKYIGIELEILVSPINEPSNFKPKKKTSNVVASFGGWADMDEFIPEKSAEQIISEIRDSRCFGKTRTIEPF